MNENYQGEATIRCFWCGSSNTFFQHYACWEETPWGATKTTHDLSGDDDCTPRDEVWWCRNCDGAFGFPVEYPEDV